MQENNNGCFSEHSVELYFYFHGASRGFSATAELLGS